MSSPRPLTLTNPPVSLVDPITEPLSRLISHIQFSWVPFPLKFVAVGPSRNWAVILLTLTFLYKIWFESCS